MKKRLCGLMLIFLLLFSPQPARAVTGCFAKGAAVIEASSGTVLYEKNGNLPLPEASTTKIMTALLTLELTDPQTRITVSPRAAAVEGSQLGLTAGEELTVSDLLHVLMLKSGNDAAVALAEGVCGSEEKFVEKMNEKATFLGLKNTHFENPHGLPAEGHRTTARELAELTAVALENEAFRALVSTQRARLEYKDLIITNSNKLLYTCQGVFGVKTGYTKAAGRCLVSAAERKGVTLICVTLNDGNDWQDHADLYDACFARVSRKEVIPQGGFHSTVPILSGDGDAPVNNSVSLTCVTLDGAPLPYEIRTNTVPMLFAPVDEGRTLGEVQLVSSRGRTVDRSALNTVRQISIKKEERTFSGSFPIKMRKLWKALTSGIAS